MKFAPAFTPLGVPLGVAPAFTPLGVPLGVAEVKLILVLPFAPLDGVLDVLGGFFLAFGLLTASRDVGRGLLYSDPGVKKDSRLDCDMERFLELAVGLNTTDTVEGPSLNFSMNSSCILEESQGLGEMASVYSNLAAYLHHQWMLLREVIESVPEKELQLAWCKNSLGSTEGKALYTYYELVLHPPPN